MAALDALRDDFIQVAKSEASSSVSRRTRLLAAGLAGLAVLLATAVVVDTDPDETKAPMVPNLDQLIAPQTAPAFMSGGPEYQTLDQLVANSQLVVAGTVKELSAGGRIVDIDPKYPTRFLHTVLTVDEALKGSAQGGAVTVRTIEFAYARVPGGPDREWRDPGQRVVAFLAPSPNGERPLVPTSYTQSFYRLEGDNVAPLSPPTRDSPKAIVGSVSLPQFREAVRAASSPDDN